MIDVVPILMLGLMATVFYKALTYAVGDPTHSKQPDIHPIKPFGDDQQHFLQGYHAENRLDTVQTVPLSEDGHSHVVMGGAIYEHNTESLNRVNTNIPPTTYFKNVTFG